MPQGHTIKMDDVNRMSGTRISLFASEVVISCNFEDAENILFELFVL